MSDFIRITEKEFKYLRESKLTLDADCEDFFYINDEGKVMKVYVVQNYTENEIKMYLQMEISLEAFNWLHVRLVGKNKEEDEYLKKKYGYFLDAFDEKKRERKNKLKQILNKV